MTAKKEYEELEEFDLGFTTFDTNEIEEVKEYQERIKKLRKLIIPFLNNLMKDPDKDIHWPNRDKIIGNFKQKLENIFDYGSLEHPAEEVKTTTTKDNL